MGIERAYSAFVSAAVCSCLYLLHTLWVGYTVQRRRWADCQRQTGNAVGSVPAHFAASVWPAFLSWTWLFSSRLLVAHGQQCWSTSHTPNWCIDAAQAA